MAFTVLYLVLLVMQYIGYHMTQNINNQLNVRENERSLYSFFFFFFLDSTARKNIHSNLYKKQNYLFYTIIV
jgi:hypothetical protein